MYNLTEFPILQTDRLILREIILSDAEDYFNIRTNERVIEFMDVPTYKNVKETEDMIIRIDKDFKNSDGINWGICLKNSNKLIGYVGFWRMFKEHFRGEIGYGLTPEHWGKGIMKEALIAVLKFGFNSLNLHSVEANCNPQNDNSMKVLEKVGFEKEAYFKENYYFSGKFLDSVIYSLLESKLKE